MVDRSKISVLPNVSIVTSVKNEEKYIADLLDSIANLNYPKDKLEIIVVDGGSTDKTIEIISRYSFVKFFVYPRSNLSEGKNLGIKKATGEIIAMVDGDCIVDKDWLKNITKHFQSKTEIGAVGGPYLPTNQNELYARYRAAWAQVVYPKKTGYTTNAIKLGGGNVAYRRKIFGEVGLFDERLGRGALIDSGEDMDINLRIMKAGYKLFYAEDVKVFHRFRTSFREASKINFKQGMDSSIYFRKSDYMSKSRIFRNLLVAFFFPIFGLLFIVSVLSGIILMSCAMIIAGFIYYIFKFIRFHLRVKTKTSLLMRIIIPIIDIYVTLLWSFGVIVGLVRVHERRKK